MPVPSADETSRLRRYLARLHVDRTLLAIAVGAFVVRLAWVLIATRTPAGIFDPARYLYIGRGIAEGEGYRDGLTGGASAYYPPGYPAFVGLVGLALRPVGQMAKLVTATLVVQAALGAAAVYLWARVTERVWGRTPAVVAAVVLALYPNLVLHSGVLLSETLFLALLGLELVIVLGSRPWPESLGGGRLVLHGLVLGLLVLVRPQGAMYLPVLAVALVVCAGPRRALAPIALTTAVTLAVVAPWTIRNYTLFHRFVPVSTNTGDNLCIGHNPGATGGFNFNPYCTAAVPYGGPAAEVRHDEELTDLAIDYLGSHLGEEPRLVLSRLRVTLAGDGDAVRAVQAYGEDAWLSPGWERLLSGVSDIAWWLVGGSALIAAAWLVRSREQVFVVVGAALQLVPVMAFFGDERFKAAIVPVVISLAAAGWVRAAQGLRGRLREHAPASGAQGAGE